MPTLRFTPKQLVLDVPEGTLLIDAIRSAGLPIARACGDDLVCARCGVRVLEGRIAQESSVERETKRRNRVPRALRLACAIRVHDDLTVTADYWGSDS
jgi:ferredoxin